MASAWDGASRTRTGDLLGAIQALSQLSYSPATVQSSGGIEKKAAAEEKKRGTRAAERG